MLTIGKLAKACDVSVDTIRYYERRKLVPPAARTEAGYRVYREDSVRRLSFVRRSQALGFTLDEIGELLAMSERPESDCGDIKHQAEQKIADIDLKIRELKKMRAGLQKLSDFCPGEGKPLSECNILHHFYGDE